MDKEIRDVGLQPDYKRIYTDIIRLRYPEKEKHCKVLLSKDNLSALDVIRLNNIIFSPEKNINRQPNQKFRSYDKSTIFKILDYQKKNNLNNKQLSAQFSLSRNTVAKWKKLFL